MANRFAPKLHRGLKLIRATAKRLLKQRTWRLTRPFLRRRFRILVERPEAMGDVLASTPILRQLKRDFPDCYLTFLADWKSEAILEHNPDVDEVVISRRHLIGRRFDRTINLVYETRPELHILDAYAECAGIELDCCDYVLNLSPADREYASNLLVQHSITADVPLIGVHAYANWPNRVWPRANFEAVIEHFRVDYGARIVVFGAEPQAALEGDIDLVGKTSIQQTAAVLERCHLLLCVDSLLLHLAGAMRTPTVCIFGPILPELRLPRNRISVGVNLSQLACIGCHHRSRAPSLRTDCVHDRIYCMEDLQPDIVIAAMERLWQGITVDPDHEMIELASS